jgi:hypothetical protein
MLPLLPNDFEGRIDILRYEISHLLQSRQTPLRPPHAHTNYVANICSQVMGTKIEADLKHMSVSITVVIWVERVRIPRQLRPCGSQLQHLVS